MILVAVSHDREHPIGDNVCDCTIADVANGCDCMACSLTRYLLAEAVERIGDLLGLPDIGVREWFGLPDDAD